MQGEEITTLIMHKYKSRIFEVVVHVPDCCFSGVHVSVSLSDTGGYLWAETEVLCRVLDLFWLLFARWFLALDRCSLAL